MRWIRRSFLLVLSLVLCVGLVTPTAFAQRPLMPNQMGAAAYSYIRQLEG